MKTYKEIDEMSDKLFSEAKKLMEDYYDLESLEDRRENTEELQQVVSKQDALLWVMGVKSDLINNHSK